MANYQPLKHPRKISEIADGEISLWGSSDGGTTWYPVKVTTDGKIYVTNDDLEALVADQLNDYKPAGIDAGATVYKGYMNKAGAWYIKRMTPTVDVYAVEYAKGSSDFATSWTGRAGLSYAAFSAVF